MDVGDEDLNNTYGWNFKKVYVKKCVIELYDLNTLLKTYGVYRGIYNLLTTH